MTRGYWIGIGVTLALLGGVVVYVTLPDDAPLTQAATWQELASPGRLSAAHSFLENNCAACHTAVRGPDPAKCIACHANNEALLQRQPTAFHAGIGSCRECHPEHLGIGSRPTVMDHAALARVGLRQLKESRPDGDARRRHDALVAWLGGHGDGGPPAGHPGLGRLEAALNCAACHGTKDRHLKLFGQDCAACHRTDRWTIPEFRHPSSRSTDCAQCHQAPPSHYMGHFHMVSAKVAGKEHAKVNQCYLCHQTTSWNDIKGVGWYKHH